MGRAGKLHLNGSCIASLLAQHQPHEKAIKINQSVNRRCKSNRREVKHYPKCCIDPEASSSIRDTSVLSQWGQGRGGRNKYLFELFTSLSFCMKTVGNQNRHPSAYGNCKQTINGNKHGVRGLVRRFYGRCSEQETFQILHSPGVPSSHPESKDLLFYTS